MNRSIKTPYSQLFTTFAAKALAALSFEMVLMMPAAICSRRFGFAVLLVLCWSRDAASAEFFGLGLLPGRIRTDVNDVSDDGSVVVGYSWNSASSIAFRWKRDSGMEALDSAVSGALAVSGDGNVVAGGRWIQGPRAAFWTDAAGPTEIGDGDIFGASADGSTLVGWSSARGAFRWNVDTGFISLGPLPGYFAGVALDVSGDGSVIIGPGALTAGVANRAWRWTAEAGMVGLGDPRVVSTANAVSGDGHVVVGLFRPDGSQVNRGVPLDRSIRRRWIGVARNPQQPRNRCFWGWLRHRRQCAIQPDERQ